MKSRYLVFIGCCFLIGCTDDSQKVIPEQQLYRYVNDRKEIVIPANDRIWIKSGESTDYFIQKYPEIKAFADSATGLRGVYIHPEKDIFDLVNRLSRDPEVIYVSPFLLNERGQEFGGLTNQIMVRLKEGKSRKDLDHAFRKYEITEYKENKYDSLIYTLTLKEKNAIKSLLIANEVHETADCFVYVEVNYLLIIRVPGDRGE